MTDTERIDPPEVVRPTGPASTVPDPEGADPWQDLSQSEMRQILSHRAQFAQSAIGIVQTWVGFLIIVTFAQIALKPLGLGLEQTEFIAVCTTTTASVFGLAYLVGKFLFPRGGSGAPGDHVGLSNNNRSL